MKKNKNNKKKGKEKQNTDDSDDIKDLSKTNKQLAAEIATFLPHVTDEVHMKVAIALNCDYKVVKAYLAGNIEDDATARQLIRHLGAIIEQGYDSFKHEVDVQDAGYRFVHMAESVLNTWKLCNSSHIALSNIQDQIFKDRNGMELTLKSIDQKLNLLVSARR